MKIVLANFDKLSPAINSEVNKYTKRLPNILEISTLKDIAAYDKNFPLGKFVRVVLSEEGNLFGTAELAKWIDSRLSKNMVFLIGSAYGIPPQTKETANLLLSLSPLTFSHEHAFLLLAEQIYRCLMVIKGHPYHHV
ncbi:hypothetical protein AGMMS49938_12980 [Fibrobacterales bacterium]|nr:hypothetical protein AGMMS49938_12980 [Fibrobacterales bacterium]